MRRLILLFAAVVVGGSAFAFPAVTRADGGIGDSTSAPVVATPPTGSVTVAAGSVTASAGPTAASAEGVVSLTSVTSVKDDPPGKPAHPAEEVPEVGSAPPAKVLTKEADPPRNENDDTRTASGSQKTVPATSGQTTPEAAPKLKDESAPEVAAKPSEVVQAVVTAANDVVGEAASLIPSPVSDPVSTVSSVVDEMPEPPAPDQAVADVVTAVSEIIGSADLDAMPAGPVLSAVGVDPDTLTGQPGPEVVAAVDEFLENAISEVDEGTADLVVVTPLVPPEETTPSAAEPGLAIAEVPELPIVIATVSPAGDPSPFVADPVPPATEAVAVITDPMPPVSELEPVVDLSTPPAADPVPVVVDPVPPATDPVPVVVDPEPPATDPVPDPVAGADRHRLNLFWGADAATSGGLSSAPGYSQAPAALIPALLGLAAAMWQRVVAASEMAPGDTIARVPVPPG